MPDFGRTRWLNPGCGRCRTLAEAFSGRRYPPLHRANMLNAGVTRMGFANVYAPKSKYKMFWALILAGGQGVADAKKPGDRGLVR